MNKLIGLILLMLAFVSVEAQNSELVSDFLSENYQEGENAFLLKMYENISYPKAARDVCRVGKLNVEITIAPSGQLKGIGFLNKLPLGYGLEEEVIRMVKMAGTGWTKIDSDSLRTVELVFAFQIGEAPAIKGDINVTATGLSCRSNQFYVSRFKKYMKNEKYEKAKEVTEELLRRDSDSEEFRKMDGVVNEKLGLGESDDND